MVKIDPIIVAHFVSFFVYALLHLMGSCKIKQKNIYLDPN